MMRPVILELERLRQALHILPPNVKDPDELLRQSAGLVIDLLRPHGLRALAVYRWDSPYFLLVYRSHTEAPERIPEATPAGPYAQGWFSPLPIREGRRYLGGLWLRWENPAQVPTQIMAQAIALLKRWAQLIDEVQQMLLFREVYCSISDAVILFDRNSQVWDANPAAERLFEYTLEEMRNLTSAELFPVSWKFVHHIGRSLLARGHWRGMIPIRTKKGEEKLTEVRVSLLGDRHTSQLIVAVIRDLSERERLQAEAAHQRLLLAHLLDVARATLRAPLTPKEMFEHTVQLVRELTGATHIALVLLNEHGGIRSFWMVGPGAEQLSQEWLTQLVAEGLQTGILGRALKRKKVYLLHDVARWPGWREWSHVFPWKSVVVLPLYSGFSSLGVLMVGHRRPHAFSKEDLQLLEGTAELLTLALRQAQLYEEQIQLAEKRLRAQEEAERYHRQTERFLTLVSHEMRTPLQAILGYLEWIRMGYGPETPLHQIMDDLDSVEQAAQTLLHLINQLLDYQKTKTEPEVVAEPFAVVKVVQQLEELIAPLMTRNMNTFTWEIHPPDLEMVSDRSKLAHILLNLLSNAAKFTRQGRVTLRIYVQPGEPLPWVVFEVEDTGIGIPEAALEYIFHPFAQADERIAHRFGGSGLGLAMVKAYAELLGGSVSVQSQEGMGSLFTVRLPQRWMHTAPLTHDT